MSKKYLIIGGVAGGMSAATRLRRLQEDAEIIVFEKGPYVSFANCGLPYYIGGEIDQREKLIVQHSEALKKRFNLDIRENSEVIEIRPNSHEILVSTDKKVYTEKYDQLILSTGAKPVIPKIEGLKEAENAFTLRNIPDADQITAYLNTHKVKSAVILGAGFIGIEMAENLEKRGIKVTIIERSNHILPTLDPEMAIDVQTELENNGLTLVLGHSVVNVSKDRVYLDDKNEISSDLILLSTGIQPETPLAKRAGVALGLHDAILVDENYETSIQDIFAVGDAIVVNNQISNQDSLISLASPANRQGRQVADVLSGLPLKNKGSIGTAIVRAFNSVAASTGLSEKTVQNLGLHHKVIHITANDHAGYYPNHHAMLLKLIFNPETGEIFGAQAVGKSGVDKRIDVLSTAIKAGLTIFDLPELELSYAPPFGSAKDPVNMIGYAAMNLSMGLSDNLQWHELAQAIANKKQILDVRNPSEIKKGAFKNAINIPLDELRQRLHELNQNQAYIVSCQSGLRSYQAERILKAAGFIVQNLDGAYGLYSKMSTELLV